MTIDKEKAYRDLVQYMLDERDHRELLQRIAELKENDESNRRRRARCKYAVWKTRYGFDIIRYVREHLDEDVESVVKTALSILERYRTDDLH